MTGAGRGPRTPLAVCGDAVYARGCQASLPRESSAQPGLRHAGGGGTGRRPVDRAEWRKEGEGGTEQKVRKEKVDIGGNGAGR